MKWFVRGWAIVIGKKDQLIDFLRNELEVPADAIRVALSHPEQTPGLLPVILWQYGLISLTQLDQIFEWLEEAA